MPPSLAGFPMSAIFVSHSSRDAAVAAEVRDWLVSQGHQSLFLDFDPEFGIPAGRNWEEELYHRLRTCRAVIVLCSRTSMASRWCFAEITQARSLGKVVLPVRIDGCNVDALLADQQITDLGVDRLEGFGRLKRGLLAAGLGPAARFEWDASRSPYPGLLAFQEQDAAVYFGRAREIGAGARSSQPDAPISHGRPLGCGGGVGIGEVVTCRGPAWCLGSARIRTGGWWWAHSVPATTRCRSSPRCRVTPSPERASREIGLREHACFAVGSRIHQE